MAIQKCVSRQIHLQHLHNQCGLWQQWHDVHQHAQHAGLSTPARCLVFFVTITRHTHIGSSHPWVRHSILTPSMCVSLWVCSTSPFTSTCTSSSFSGPSSPCAPTTLTPWQTTCATPPTGPSSPPTTPSRSQDVIVVQDERKTSRSQEINVTSCNEELCSSDRSGQLGITQDLISVQAWIISWKFFVLSPKFKESNCSTPIESSSLTGSCEHFPIAVFKWPNWLLFTCKL